ncbi:MAG: hypothetical protein ACKPKO_48420 [Candidatus Fonsibacter sp.]
MLFAIAITMTIIAIITSTSTITITITVTVIITISITITRCITIVQSAEPGAPNRPESQRAALGAPKQLIVQRLWRVRGLHLANLKHDRSWSDTEGRCAVCFAY